jgi:hypothetical protein
VYQHEYRDVLSVVVPWDGSSGQPMRSCMPVDPLSAQAICRPGLFPRYPGEDVLDEFSR